MGNFGNKWNKFVQIFIEKNGYVKVVQGLQNTLLIAVVGMIIGRWCRQRRRPRKDA